MHCVPGMTQMATCEKQICLCIKHYSSLLHVFLSMECYCHDSCVPFTLCAELIAISVEWKDIFDDFFGI